MTTYRLGDVEIATWGQTRRGQQIWHVEHLDGRVAEFTAVRDADPGWLEAVAHLLIGDDLDAGDLAVLAGGLDRLREVLPT